MTEEEIRHLQEMMNKVGGLLETNGISGPATRRAIGETRALAGLPAGEEADQQLIHWLESQPDPSPDLPTKGVTFIAREEVGGRGYYEKHTAVPHWPGESSGITIGVGCGSFRAPWGSRTGAWSSERSGHLVTCQLSRVAVHLHYPMNRWQCHGAHQKRSPDHSHHRRGQDSAQACSQAGAPL